MRWSEVDLANRVVLLQADPATKRNVKSDTSRRLLSQAACDIISGRPKIGDRVFPSQKQRRGAGVYDVWEELRVRLGIPDTFPHVFRHTFTTIAAEMNYPVETRDALTGHVSAGVTSGYTHIGDRYILEAADAVARRILAFMGEGSGGDVVALRHAQAVVA